MTNDTPRIADYVLPRVPSEGMKRLEEILHARVQSWAWKSNPGAKSKPYIDDDITNSISALDEEELGAALVRSCQFGDLTIAKKIWSSRGPFGIEYVRSNLQDIVNGLPVAVQMNSKDYLANAESTSKMQELLEWMPTVGLGFMVGVGTSRAMLLNSYQLWKPQELVREMPGFSGSLPILSAGVLTNPELLVGLQDMVNKSHFPDAYNHVLCWATPDMVSEMSSNLNTYRVNQFFQVHERGDPTAIRKLSYDECTSDFLADVCPSKMDEKLVDEKYSWVYDKIEIRTVSESATFDPHDLIVLKHLGSESIQLGYDHPEGLILCRTTVDFLNKFEIGHVCKGNFEVAEQFCNSYFPLDLIAMYYGENGLQNGNAYKPEVGMMESQGGRTHWIHLACKLLRADSPVRENLAASVQKSIWEFLLKYNSKYALDAEDALSLYSAMGIDNSKLKIILEVGDIDLMYKGGYIFSDETNLIHSSSSSKINDDSSYVKLSLYNSNQFLGLSHFDNEQLSEVYRSAIKMNLWPSESKRPDSLSSALKMLSKKKSLKENDADHSLKAYFQIFGAEACAKEATTSLQWERLSEVFDTSTMSKFVGMAPASARGKLLEDNLGL